MRRIAHISDLHFGRVDPVVAAALLADLDESRPDLVIVSGDLTMGARRSEFRAAADFLARIAAPWIAVPGNHDISPYRLVQRFTDPFRRWRRYIHPITEPDWHDEEIAVVGLNSARAMALELDWSQGRLGKEQIRRVEERFAALASGAFRIVVAHHPFLPPEFAPDTRVVGRADEALSCFQSLGVGLTLAGHLHRGYARILAPVIDAAGELTDLAPRPPERAASRDLLVVQAGSAISTRLRDEPNAYNRIRIEDGIAAVEARLWTGDGWASAEEAGAAAVAVP